MDQPGVPKPRVVVLVGLPGSGKSRWARQQRVAVISTDEIRFLLSDDENNQSIHRMVYGTVRNLLRQRLQLRRPVTYIDATNLTPKDRRPFLKMAQLYDCRVEAVYFDVPVEVSKARNRVRSRVVPDEVIDMMAQRLRPPTVEEGFDAVMVYSPTGVAPQPTPRLEAVRAHPSPSPEF